MTPEDRGTLGNIGKMVVAGFVLTVLLVLLAEMIT
jgi:hypothetical protein